MKMMNGLIMNSKDERQLQILKKYTGAGTLIGATGFGKTYTALKIIQKSLIKNKNHNFIVVVPTVNLKEQWENQINKLKITNTLVYVINTACALNSECTLLILDEIHMYGGDVFSNVFKIKYKYILGLTATLDKDSNIYNLINKYCPVFDEVTLEECRNNNWVTNYKVYNLSVDFTKEEASKYNKIDYLYRKSEYALGGRFVAFDNANYHIKNQTEHKSVAFMYLNAVKQRRSLLINAQNKIKAIQEITELLPNRKTLVFCESIDFAKEVNDLLPKSTIYHSKVNKKIKDASLEQFKNGEINTMISVKALNAGLDIPDCSLGIIASGNSKTIDDVQRVGRVIRVNEDKENSIIINLFVKNTQDEIWLQKRQLHQIPIPIQKVQDIL